MANPPGVPSALGIDAVEWFSEGGEGLVVRVTAHWRRRRPPLRRRPQLVIEGQGQRLRFSALPEPPSLTGAPAGRWQMSFSVPPSAAPHLGGRMWLQIGGVSVPLPVPEAAVGEAAAREAGVGAEGAEGAEGEQGEPSEMAGPGDPADPETIARRELRSAELAAQTARERLTEAEATEAELAATIAQLESELERARSEPARLEALLSERERERRSAEQRAHAEYSLRMELEEEIAEQEQQGNRVQQQMELAAGEERIRELERELEVLRRRADEAEQVEAAARALRGGSGLRARSSPEERLREELAVAVAALAPAQPAPGVPGSQGALAALAALGLGPEPIGLRRELQLVSLRPSPSAAPAEDRDLRSTLADLARELATLRDIAEQQRAGRLKAQARVAELERQFHEHRARAARVYQAIEALRDDLEAVRSGRLRRSRGAAGPPVPEPPAAGPVEPERLAAALIRLREATPPLEAAERAAQKSPAATQAGSPTRAWLARAFKTLAARDPAGAGRLLLALLPAQPAVHPDPVRYDLVLGERSCVQVSSTGGSAQVFFGDTPRAPEEVDFQVHGDLSAVARRLAAGRVRRRLGRGLAEVRGTRSSFVALEALVGARLTLRELHAAGVRVDPQLTLLLVSVMIDRRWTAGEHFTVAYQGHGSQAASSYLEVRDGRQVTVTDAPHPGPVDATIVCPADDLPALLTGELAPGECVRGEERPIQLLRQWLELAQSGRIAR